MDAATCSVRRDGREFALHPKAVDVLRYLFEHRERVVSKHELLNAVWHGDPVRENAVALCISHAREALGQRRGQRTPIETVQKHGYRFSTNAELVTLPVAATRVAERRPQQRPFVGRAEIMQRLHAGLERAQAGRGGLYLLLGAEGSGKTRCVQELLAEVGVPVWSASASGGAGEPSFWLFLQVLRQCGQSRPQLSAACDALIAELRAAPSEPVERFWLLDRTVQLLLEVASAAPLLLVLEDLHLADEGSVELLAALARRLPETKLACLTTLRDDPAPTKLARLSQEAECLVLTGLELPDVIEYLGAFTQGQSVPEEIASAVHAATSGAPSLLQECVRELLRTHGEHALLKLEPNQIAIPELARPALHGALLRLDQPAQQLLACASVLGAQFELPLLAAVAEVPLERVLLRLEWAERAGLLRAESPQRYAFTPPALCSLLYDELPNTTRIQLHARAADVLERQPALEPRHAEIALHLYRALPLGTHVRVVPAAIAAGQAAERSFQHRSAQRFYAWALEAQAFDHGASPRERADLLLACGRAQRNAGQEREARGTLERLFELARLHSFSDLLVRGARVLRPTVAMSSVPDALVRKALDHALRITQGNPDSARVYALSQLACLPPYAADMQQSKQLSQRALELARSLGERSALFEALRARLFSLSGPDDTTPLLAVADEILTLDRDRPGKMTLEAHSARLGALLYRGDPEAAESALGAFGQLARELRLPEAIWYYDRQRAQRRYLLGDFTGANSACSDLRLRSSHLGLGYGVGFMRILHARVRLDQEGRPDATFTNKLEAFTSTVEGSVPNVRARYLRRAALSGKLDVARAGLDSFAAGGLANIPKEIAYLNTLASLAVAAITLRDLERAEQLYTLLAPYPQHNTPDTLLLDEGSVSHYLALLAELLGWHDRVEPHFHTALVVNRGMGRRPQLARTYHDFAAWLAAQDRAGCSAQAQQMARESYAHAEALGMHWLASAARSLMT